MLKFIEFTDKTLLVMKKTFTVLIILGLFLGLLPKNIYAEDNYFIVTAYYSPLPDQEYYMMGDFESEKVLQGNGTNGASGKEVFSGMIAAPSKYSFGTKIYLEGIGVGVVEDRGGAILKAENTRYKYDRIDVWMGYGDDGLKRALAWGKRTVKGHVASSDTEVTFDYNNRISPDWAVKGLKSTKFNEVVFDYNIGKDSSIENIKSLQRFLAKIGIYNGEIDGNYMGEVIDIVFDFQLANSIISSENEVGAGYWGTKTRSLFKKMYLNGDFEIRELTYEQTEEIAEIKNEEDIALKDIDEETTKKIVLLENKKDEDLFSSFFETEEEIKKALEIMKSLKIYNGTTDLTYEQFIDVIFDFQVENSIVKTQYDEGAGYFGPQTRNKLKEMYFKYIDEEIVIEKNIQSEEKENILNELRKKELEEKYKELRGNALSKTEKKIKNIGILRKGDVSANVRELQKTLSDLGYFNHNDTAIFGDITKKAVSDFQMKYNLIDSYNSEYAGILGERTLEALSAILYKKYYEEEIVYLKNETIIEGL